jgi:hypothetical protein
MIYVSIATIESRDVLMIVDLIVSVSTLQILYDSCLQLILLLQLLILSNYLLNLHGHIFTLAELVLRSNSMPISWIFYACVIFVKMALG